jgi:hypothetical protein
MREDELPILGCNGLCVLWQFVDATDEAIALGADVGKRFHVSLLVV